MARKESWEWEDYLTQILLTQPAEVLQEASQVLEEHGCSVKKLKSELYYSSTLCQVVFQALHYANLIVAHAPTAWTALMYIHLHHLLKDKRVKSVTFSFTCVQLSSVYCVMKMCTHCMKL